MGKNDRMVYKKDDVWVNKKNVSEKASSTHKTQKEAIDAARENVKKSRWWRVSIKGENGKIR